MKYIPLTLSCTNVSCQHVRCMSNILWQNQLNVIVTLWVMKHYHYYIQICVWYKTHLQSTLTWQDVNMYLWNSTKNFARQCTTLNATRRLDNSHNTNLCHNLTHSKPHESMNHANWHITLLKTTKWLWKHWNKFKKHLHHY